MKLFYEQKNRLRNVLTGLLNGHKIEVGAYAFNAVSLADRLEVLKEVTAALEHRIAVSNSVMYREQNKKAAAAKAGK